MPREREALAVLEEWRALFAAVEAIQLDPDGDLAVLRSRLEERQRLIDAIQRLDGDVKRIAELGRQNWPGFSPEGAEAARKLLFAARASCDATRSADAATSEKIKYNQSVVSSQLQDAKQHKKYLPANKASVKHDPIIVDDHA